MKNFNDIFLLDCFCEKSSGYQVLRWWVSFLCLSLKPWKGAFSGLDGGMLLTQIEGLYHVTKCFIIAGSNKFSVVGYFSLKDQMLFLDI